MSKLVSDPLWQSLKQNNIISENRLKRERVRTTFLSTDGREINTNGTAEMTLKLGKVDIEHQIFVGGVIKKLLEENVYMK